MGANVFRDIEGFLEHFVQSSSGVALLQRQFVGLLHLSKDFRFTKHHGVQSANHLEQMLHAGRLRHLI